jgi:hypothetical protein
MYERRRDIDIQLRAATPNGQTVHRRQAPADLSIRLCGRVSVEVDRRSVEAALPGPKGRLLSLARTGARRTGRSRGPDRHCVARDRARLSRPRAVDVVEPAALCLGRGRSAQADYHINATTTRWLSADVNGDRRANLVHLWVGGINTLLSNADGAYHLAAEDWMPKPDYQMTVVPDLL